jgi:Mg-chelatase subunit ChlD
VVNVRAASAFVCAFGLFAGQAALAEADKSTSINPGMTVAPVLKGQPGGGLITQPIQSGTSSTSLQSGTSSTSLQTSTSSTTLQTGTDSTMLKVGTDSTLLKMGTDSTLLKMGTDSTLLQTGTQSSLLQTGIERKGGPVNVLFLVDCSFSMKEKLSGADGAKMHAATQVLEQALARIPSDINVGLRVFGQGSFLPGMDCQSTALLVPLGTGNRATMITKVRNLKPFGMTPLEYAIRQAAEDDFSDSKGTKTLILITDGADTCGGDPCRFIRELPMLGIRVKVDIVGLVVRDKQGKEQLNCIAEQSGGKYYDANTAGQLIESVSTSVNKAISGQVLSPAHAKNTETPPELQPIQPFVAH